MRTLTARQKGEGGGWHYVSVGRHGGYPIGYCAEHEPHPTETEARECFAKYRRDNIRLDGKMADWSGCDVDGCDKPTKNAARSGGYNTAMLCDEHLTIEHAVKALGFDGPAGDSWQS